MTTLPVDPPAVPPVPAADDKDWTWVLARPCPECGFDASAVDRASFGSATLAYAAALAAAASATDGARRPSPAVWSPLEYACHVRDVCATFSTRLALMLTSDDPLFENWDQDETALAARYWEQPASAVVPELRAAAASTAAAWDLVPSDAWQRPGRRSNGSVFTVDSLGRYFLHDLAHHAWDARA